MKKSGTQEIYQRYIAAAVEYINLHLDEELELVGIAEVANFSLFYFHRIFKAFRDEPVFEKYCNDPAKTVPEKLKTEIYIPIK